MTNLPPNWIRVPISEVATVRGGIQKQAKRRPVQNKYPFLRVANVARGSLNLSEIHEIELFAGELERYSLRSGDLLVVEGNGSPKEIGRAAIWNEEIANCVHQNHLICIRPSSAILPKFLELLWNSPNTSEQLRKVASTTSGLYTLSTSKLKRIEIPLPPLAEQHRIITALERQFEEITHANSIINQVNSQAKILREKIIDSISSGQIFNTENSVDGDPELASGWRWAKPDELTSGLRNDITIGPFGSNLKVSDYTTSGVPLVFVRDIRLGKFGLNNPKFISPDKAHDLQSHSVRRGDVLITKMGDPPGDAAVYTPEQEGVITADCIRLRPGTGWNSDYLAIAINSSLVRRQIKSITRGVAQQKISLARFRQEVLIPVPPIELQDTVLTEANRHLLALSTARSGINKAEKRSSFLYCTLLTEAFSGRLVPQDPTEEPASVLLKRLRA